MKHRIYLFSIGLTTTALAPAQTAFVDLYEEGYHPQIVYRSNDGQVIDTDYILRPDVIAKSEGLPFTLWPREHSTLSFSWLTTSDPAYGPDAVHRIDMHSISETAEDVTPVMREAVPGLANYYYPHTAPDGVEGVEAYSEVFYQGIYPDIDLILYSGSGGPKMAVVCEVGSEPADILLQFHGQDSLRIDGVTEELEMYKDGYEVRIPEAIAYQIDGTEVNLLGWEANYVQQNDSDMVSFTVGTYDPGLPLVFLMGAPPQAGGGGGSSLDWNTTVGNDVGSSNDHIWGSDVGDDGSLFVAGHTSSDLFPASTGSQPSGYGTDVFVSHFLYNPGFQDDAQVDWTTFIGGTGYDKAQALHVADAGDVYAIGWTNSSDISPFPLANPNDGTYWENLLKGSEDGLIIKLEPLSGFADNIATFGGDGVDILTAITEDVNGNIYIGGNTTSEDGPTATCESPSSGMPLCDPGGGAHYEDENAGGLDVVLLRLDPDFYLTWATFWGTAEDDRVFDMAPTYTQVGVAYGFAMVGSTYATIPAGPVTGFQQAGNSEVNGFVATFNTAGVKQWATNLHGLNDLQAVTSNLAGRLVVAGTHVIDPNPSFATSCTPVANSLCICDPGNNAEVNNTNAGGADNYIAEFSTPSGTLVWGTLLGGSTEEYPTDNMAVSGSLDYQVTDQYRNMDLEMAPNGELYFMGISGYGLTDDQIAYSGGTYPQVNAWGHYARPAVLYPSALQTDVSLHRFSSSRELIWSTLYGANEATSGDVVNDQLNHITHGSDYGHDMALYPSTAIYWTGTTGTYAFDDECPTVGGTSYCEVQPSLFQPDQFDGFIARMDIDDLNIGINETAAPVSAVLSVRGNGFGTWTVFLDGSPLINTPVDVYDAIGRLVISTRTDVNGQLSSNTMANGHYTLIAPSKALCKAVSFVVAR